MHEETEDYLKGDKARFHRAGLGPGPVLHLSPVVKLSVDCPSSGSQFLAAESELGSGAAHVDHKVGHRQVRVVKISVFWSGEGSTTALEMGL
jgi:hypothetical protein